MNWTEITVKIPTEYTDTAAAIANMTVPYGIYIEDYSDLEAKAEEIAHIDLIDEELINKDRTEALIHIYISECDNAAEALAFLKERLTAENIPFSCGAEGVNDADWSENWKKYFHATEIGDKLAIVPSWEEYDNKENRKILHIDPGAAFGTGTHATTSLCLSMLENYVAEGSKMLDIGCGSGILSIAALRLGADKAVGVDIDGKAEDIARENAAYNGFSAPRFTALTGNVTADHRLMEQLTQEEWDIVLVNIVADVIVALAPVLPRLMGKGTRLICSGILDTRLSDVLDALTAAGLTVTATKAKDDWRCVTAIRKYI